MGGKTSSSQQTVAVPSQVLAQYQSVNALANQTAKTPFQDYSGQFVAPVNSQQQSGISGVNASANEAQPYYGAATGTLGNAQAGTTGINDAATGLAAASSEQVNADPLTGQQINSYLSPYLGDVLGSTSALLNQNNQQQQAGQLGSAIQSGAFGGDRTGLAAANLEQQQNLANANIYSGIANQGYVNAQGVAQQQQGVNLSAGQANRAALGAAGSELAGIGQTAYGEGANTASELGALGSGAQAAGLSGANAQIAAGTVQQQTQQAQDTAEYNQFLQQESYPFQVDQFLANIAEGTGALSGSTTTTTQPGGFFSDRRLKTNIKKIGKTYDGQEIYSYKMHGDPRTHIGLMAQNVEKKHPEAVGLAGGYKIVDYGAATEKAANRGHFYEGGVVPFRAAKAMGGPSIVSDGDLSAILQAQQQMYAPMSGGAGVYGGVAGGVPRGGSSRVPAPSGAVPHLVTAGGLGARPTPAENTKNILDTADTATKLYKSFNQSHPKPSGGVAPTAAPIAAATPGDVPVQQTTTTTTPSGLARGGVAGRRGFDGGGFAADSLAAQDAMYSNDRKPKQVDIPSSGGSHQLTVASGSPTPASSGSSNLNNGLGLAQKGYQAYKYFNTPASTTAPELVTPDMSSSAITATAPATDSSTISGLASTTPATADAAAGSGAAASAAGDAAAGAAGSAAVDAGGTAAAEAAAALAAEEAAPEVAAALIEARRGGAIRRKYDAGGMPYSDSDGSLDIPDASASGAKVQTAGPLVKQPTGLQTLETLGTEQGAQGAISGMFSNQALSRGGLAGARRGFDDGGDVDPSDVDPNYSPQGVARGVINRNPKAPDLLYTRDAGSVIPYAAPPAPGLGAARPANSDMGGKNFGVKPSQDNWDVGPPAPTGLGAAAPTPVRDPVQYTGGVGLESPAAPDAQTPSPVSVDKPSWWDKIKGSELAKPENLIPLLTAISAMGTAPTKHLGVALAAGLGAGAQSYMPTQQALADVAQTKATTGLTGSETAGENIQNLAQLQHQYAIQGFALIEDPSGQIAGPDGKHYRPVAKGTLLSNGQPATAAPQYSYLGKNGVQTAKNEGIQYSTAAPEVQNASGKQIDEIYQAGNAAQGDMLHTQHWEQVMAANKGALDPGSQSELRTKAVNMWNTAMQQAGLPQAQLSGLADAQMAQKMSIGAAAAGENANQQRSFGALKAFLAATPNTDMSRDAAIPLIADMHTQQQMAIDKKNYLDEFDKENQRNFGAPVPRNYLATDALQSFDKDYPSNNYEGERDKLSGIIRSPRYPALMNVLKNGTSEQKQQKIKELDSAFGPNFHRYFTGS